MSNHDRYKEFERAMAAALLGNTLLFIVYLVAAGAGILWLKVVLAALCLLTGAMGLLMLYVNRELTKSRSLWMSCGFFALLCCTVASLILAYPG